MRELFLTGGKRTDRGHLWIVFALFAVCLACSTAVFAATPYNKEVPTDGSLLTVTTGANADAVTNGTPQDYDVKVLVKADQTADSSTAGDLAAWYFHGNGIDPDTNDTPVGFHSVTLDGAMNNARATLYGNGTDKQGLLRVINAQSAIAVRNLNLTGGQLEATDAAKGGAGMYLGSMLDSASASTTTAANAIDVTNATVYGNHVKVDTTAATGTNAFGGGIYVLGGNFTGGAIAPNSDVTFNNVILRGNSIELDSATSAVNTDSSTMGGGARIAYSKGFTYNGGVVENNTNTILNGSHAHGGGISFDGNHADTGMNGVSLSGVSFTNNLVKAIGKGDVGAGSTYARGGGFFGFSLGGTPVVYTFDNGTTFTGNRAWAEDAGVIASGGAVHLRESVDATFTGVTFKNNTAYSRDGLAVGGAVATDAATAMAQNLKFVNSRFENNQANGATAFGGAVYMDNGGVLELSATAGGSTYIAGNTANGAASGLHFANASGASAASLIVGGAGDTYLLDPVTAAMGAGAFSFTKQDAGNLVWGGKNVLSSTTASNVLIGGTGVTTLAKDFSLGVANGTDSLDVNVTSSLKFTADRIDRSAAYFNFNNVAGGNGALAATGALLYDSGRTFQNVRGDFVLVDNAAGGVTTAEMDAAAANWDASKGAYITGVKHVNDQIVATVGGNPLYDKIVQANPNSYRARHALEEYINLRAADGSYLLSDAEVDFVAYNINRATPEIALARAAAGFFSARSMAETAIEHGLRRLNRDVALYGSAAVASDSGLAAVYGRTSGPRFWVGYTGDYNNVDGDKGYYGYKLRQHGVVTGANFDIGDCTSIGVYAGYAHGETKSRVIPSEVDTNSLHLGLLGRFSPIAAAPQFSILGDLGYVYAHNNSWRRLQSIGGIAGNRLDSKFNQHLYTIGTSAEYEIRYFNFSLTPSVGVRWTHLRQRGVNESGGILAMRSKSFNADSLATTLGVEAGYDIRAGSRAVITPVVGVAWRHEWADRNYSTTAYYNAPGATIGTRVHSGPVDRATAEIKAAIKSSIDIGGGRRLGVNAAYTLGLSGNTDNHSVYAGLELAF